jgi:hypothetical protein
MFSFHIYDALCKVEKQVHNVRDLHRGEDLYCDILVYKTTRCHNQESHNVDTNGTSTLKALKRFQVCKGVVWRHRPSLCLIILNQRLKTYFS